MVKLEAARAALRAFRMRGRRGDPIAGGAGPGATGVIRQRLDGVAVQADAEAMLPRVRLEAAVHGVHFDIVKGR